MNNATVILATLVVYKLLLVGIGLWAQKRTSSSDDFFIGGRALGPVVAAISYSASSSSAWTLLGLSGAAFVMGVSALWLVAGSVGGMLVAWYFVGPRLRQLSHEHKLVTLTELLALGTEGSARKAMVVGSAFVVLFAFAFYVAAQFQGAGNTFNQVFGLSMTSSIVLGSAIILVYTLLGGFWAVSVTDTVQGMLMAFAALLLPIAALIEVGGFGGFIEGLRAVSTPEQLSFSGRNTGLAAIGFVIGIAGIALGTFGQPHLLVRFMALRDDRALRTARILTITWFLIVFGGMCFLGLVGHILIPDLSNPEYVFFAMTDHLFPALIAGILVAAVLSAIMSTADSQLLVGASAVAHDLGFNKRFPGRELLVSRLAMTMLVILAIIVSLNLPATIFKRALLAWTLLGASFGPLVFFRIAGANIKPWGAVAAVATGFTIAVLFHFNPGDLAAVISGGHLPATIFERVFSFIAGVIVLLLSRTGKPLS